MPEPYNQLRSLTESQAITIHYIHGVPRTGTTIVEKALGQNANAMVNEPFYNSVKQDNLHFSLDNYSNGHFNRACEFILSVCQKALSRKERAVVVVKDVSGTMPLTLLEQWLHLATNVVTTYKDPATQFISFCRAFYSKIKQQPAPLPRVFSGELLNFTAMHQHPEGPLLVWERCEKRWADFAEERQKLAPLQTSLLIETTLLRAYPQLFFQALSSQLMIGNPFDVQKWDKNFDPILGEHHPFQLRAINSTSIAPLKPEEIVPLECLSGISREFAERQMPLYLTLLSSPNNVFMPHRSQLASLPCYGHETDTLKKLHPSLSGAINKARPRVSQIRAAKKLELS